MFCKHSIDFEIEIIVNQMEAIDLNVVIPVPKRVKQKISNEMRKQIINRYYSGFRPKDIALMFGVKTPTVSKICQKYVKTGLVFKQKGGHRKAKLNETQKGLY